MKYHGSSKDITSKKKTLTFKFSDYYSIFDYGRMPDKIPGKGKYVAKMGKYFFEKLSNPSTFKNLRQPPQLFQDYLNTPVMQILKQEGAKTHYLKSQSKSMQVKKFLVPQISSDQKTYSYKVYQSQPQNILLPLEVIFRFGASQGSSLLRRSAKELRELELTEPIKPNSFFNKIVIEYTTKLEKKDRKLTKREALEISGLSEVESEQLEQLVRSYAMVLFNEFNQAGFKLWDGKFEFAYGTLDNNLRELILVDAIGPDELRLTRNHISYSKEFLRQCYPDWDRKSLPPSLKTKQIKAASAIYQTLWKSLNQGHFWNQSKHLKHLDFLNQHIVIFGKGGREHALAKHLADSPLIRKITVIPGNPGMVEDKIFTHNPTHPEIFCQHNQVTYAIIGPEDLIAQGLSERLNAVNIPVIAPSRTAAELESSKAFSKNFMLKYNIPTARFEIFKQKQKALDFVTMSGWNEMVVKKSGLAAGKGVIVCDSTQAAIEAVDYLFEQGEELIIEEKLCGREVSYFAICLNQKFIPLGSACDYKRLLDQNEGPNTGGMGCYSPAHWLSDQEIKFIEKNILQPTLQGMIQEEKPFTGILFLGLMMTPEGAKVLEYNTRFGDPETQTILPRIASGLDRVFYFMAIKKKLKAGLLKFKPSTSVHLVKASKGYPGFANTPIEDGKDVINNFKSQKNSYLYFAGVDHNLKSQGGRILGVTCLGESLLQARTQVYQKSREIYFEGEQFRGDIGL